MQTVEIYFRGLQVRATVDCDPGQYLPTYDCAGVPPSGDIDIEDISLDDPDEFQTWDVLEEHSAELVRIVNSYHARTGHLLDSVRDIVRRNWEEDIEHAIYEEYIDALSGR
jgi:hypothetical protein